MKNSEMPTQDLLGSLHVNITVHGIRVAMRTAPHPTTDEIR